MKQKKQYIWYMVRNIVDYLFSISQNGHDKQNVL